MGNVRAFWNIFDLQTLPGEQSGTFRDSENVACIHVSMDALSYGKKGFGLITVRKL